MNFALIGGSQSSGSSLLRQILNRNGQVYCLNESQLFAKKALYLKWPVARNRIHKLNSEGWHIYSGINPDSHDGPIISDQFHSFNDFESYCSDDLVKTLEFEGAMLMDKTPANVFVADYFLKQFQDSRVVLTVRNPYDTIASLIKRGKHVLDATALVKSAYCKTLDLLNNQGVFLMVYEKLVTNPEQEVKRLCKFLDLDFNIAMIQAGNPRNESNTKIDSWQFDETEKISPKGIGSFNHLTQKKQDEILSAFEHIHWLTKDCDIEAFMEFFQYDRLESKTDPKLSWKLHLYKELMLNSFKAKPYNLFNNPIRIS